MKKHCFGLALVLACLFFPGHLISAAGLRLPAVVGDHMVLQRDTVCRVWGWAPAGARVSLTVGWAQDAKKAGNKAAAQKNYSARADGDGRWEMKVSTPAAGGPYEMVFRCGKEEKCLSDVLVGEVWICSGQSNMRDPVPGYRNQPVAGGVEAVLGAGAYAGRIHLLHVREDTTQVVQQDMKKSCWERADGPAVARFSAIGYFFARRLTDALGVPVGVIDNSWGGSTIETWMPQETFDKAVKGVIPEERYREVLARRSNQRRNPWQMGSCYYGRVAPIAGYTARGFLWYQGCSNKEDRYYDRTQAGMVARWRADWGDAACRMPFYFVTITPYAYGKADGTARPFFVETQLRSLELIPNSAAAIGETLGERSCIHPGRKAEIADQLFLYAMERDYGMKTGLGCGFAKPDRFEFKNGKAVVWLKDIPAVGMGHQGTGPVRGFELAGADSVFHAAKAVYLGKRKVAHKALVVSSPDVPDPVAVRYGWHNWHTGNLETSSGVPVPCFRSDDWPEK